MKKKYVLLLLITLCIELAISIGVANVFSVRLVEIVVFVGAACSVIIYFFTSSGGPLTTYVIGQNAGTTGISSTYESFAFKKGPIFIGSVIYFLIGLVLFILLIKGIIAPA